MSATPALINILNKAKDKGFTVNVKHDDNIIHIAFIVDDYIAETKAVNTLEEEVVKFIDWCLWSYETNF